MGYLGPQNARTHHQLVQDIQMRHGLEDISP